VSIDRLARTLWLLSQGRTVPEIGIELGMRSEAVEAMFEERMGVGGR